MKKKFILLAMMLLTLIGGVNLNVLNAQEQYRIKSVSTGKYITIFNNTNCTADGDEGTYGGVGVADYTESNSQIFTFEANSSGYYVKSADGYYLKCHNWNVDAYSTTNPTFDASTLIGFDFDGGTFSLRKLGSSKYFKVEYNSDGGNYYIYCDCDGITNGTIETWKLEPVIVDDGIIPAAPTNLVATAIDHKSISLTWTAGDENALKYNIYQGGVNIGSTTETSYTVEGLTAETNYCFTVEAVRGVNVSESHSNEACATTSEVPATRDIVFLLQDSYGDGWNGGYLNVSVNEGTPQKLEFPCSGWSGCITKEYTLSIEVGAKVNVTYSGGSYPSECTYSISYFEGDVIRANAALDVFEFTVVALTPSVTVTPNSIAFGSVKVGDEYWSEKPEPSFDVNVTAKNTTIASISCDNDFFTFTPALSGAAEQTEFNFTVSYDKEAEAGQKTGTITVKYIDGEEEKSETISLSATAYVPAQGDVVENPKAIVFTEGAYTDNVTGVYDDYILPGEENDGNNGDAVYTFTLENEAVVTANVTGTNPIVAIYDEDFGGEGGPSSDNNNEGGSNEPAAPSAQTTFFYDFEDGSLEDFILIEKDVETAGYSNHLKNWEILTGQGVDNSTCIHSQSYSNNPKINNADNYIVTKSKYSINSTSKLIFDGRHSYDGDPDGLYIEVSTDGVTFTQLGEKVTFSGAVYNNIQFDLGAKLEASGLAYGEYHIALHHNEHYHNFVRVDNLQLTDGSKSRSLAQTRSTSSQIENVYPAGTYYLVAAAEGDFTLNISTGDIPAPEATTYVSPENNATEVADATLVFQLGKYTTEYQVLLGTSADALETVVEWTSELASSYTLENAANNTKYYWQVNTRNEAGTTTGEIYNFVTPLEVPQNVTVSDSELYPGDETTVSWEPVDGVTAYNVYVNGLLEGSEITETSYTLSTEHALTYNVTTGNEIIVTAIHSLGESPMVNPVYVKVAGTFPLTVNVKDSNNNPIEGATVTINVSNAYDQFQIPVEEVEVEPTNAEGKTTVTLPLLSGYFVDNGYYKYPSYTVEVSKTPYIGGSQYIGYSGLANGTEKSIDIILYLPTPSSIYPENYEYMLLAGGNLTLNWTDVEGVTGYNVYKTSGNGVYTFVETVTENTYTAVAEYDAYGSKYAVSAVFEGGLESDKAVTYDYIYVLGTGDVKGLVTDTEGNPVAGAALELSGTNGFGEDIHILETEADGTFLVEDVIEGTYSLTVSHYNYEVETVSGIFVNYNIPYDLGTIVLTPKASIENVTVTADNSGNVSWTGDYAKWNVYRRNTNAPQELTSVATKLEATSTTDTEWETLEPGTYQYGVAGFVEDGTEMGVQLSENFDDGVMPEGWNVIAPQYTSYGQVVNWEWYVYNGQVVSTYANGDITTYLITPLINTNNAQLSFTYSSQYYQENNRNDFNVRYSTSPDGPWSESLYYRYYGTNVSVEIDLSVIEAEQVYIAFCNTNVGSGGNRTDLDDIVITGEVTSEVETQIVWSNDVVKQGPATFIGGDTENPTAWNVDANWSTGSVPADGADVIINADAVISSEVNVASITINNGDSYPYNTLTVADKGILTVTGTISQQSEYLLVLEEGGQIFQNNNNVKARFRMSIDNPSDWSDETNKDGWQFISMPLENVPHTDFTSYGEYDLYKYDGSQDLEWQNHKDGGFDYGGVPETTFRLGHGYLASLKDTETATVYGTLNTATSKTWGQYYVYDKDLANFQLIGNPFTFDMDMTKLNSNETMVAGYAVVNANGEYEYKTDGTVKVGEGFFVKVATNYAHLIYDHNAKSTRSSSNNSLNITATGNAGEDNVIINLAGKSEGFDKLQNFNDAIATVYVAEDGKNYGIYNCDADVQEVELSFNANQMGNYTISIEPNGKFQTVTLVDRFTGIETNMLVEDYHFTAMSNVNTNRFIVRMVNGQESTDNSHFVYQSGEDLIIDAEGTVQIIDVMGRVLVSDEVESTNNRINVSGFRNGTYMVRVINGSEVKVEKVVIY